MISVIICTYNNHKSLKNTLDSLIDQDCNNDFNYEIIVVDNNSRDRTKDIVEAYKAKLNGKLRYVFEANQGTSYARNRGIKEAKGDIVAFTDDDVIVTKGWLNSISLSFSEYNCDVVFGKILPKWEKRKPDWLTKRYYGNLALLDYGDKIFRIDNKQKDFYTANCSIKKSIFSQVGDFDIRLGDKGNSLLKGEDTDLFWRLLAANKNIYYIPDCIVYHVVKSKRMNKKYFKKFWILLGRHNFIQKPSLYKNQNKKYFIGIPYYLYKRLIKRICSYLKKKVFSDESADQLFERELEIYVTIGNILEAYRHRKDKVLGER